MKKCLICNTNDANQTGSHIIPHFLVKRIDNQEGEKGRDKELGFVFDINDSRMYFGRAVLPEKIEELYGDIDEQLLEQNNIIGIVDNFFCRECEKKLASLESEYSNSLKIFSEPNTAYESNKTPFLGFLFWMSIIWRLSIMPDGGINLKDKEQKKLARILKKYLHADINDIIPDVNDCDLLDIGYKILRSANLSDSFPTFQYSHPFFERPYSIMIDEFIVFIYFKKSYIKGMIHDFFGSYELQKKSSFNSPFYPEEIYSVEHEDYKEIVRRILQFFAEKKLSKLDVNLDLMHQRLFPNGGKKMDLRLKKTILENIGKSEEKPGRKNLEHEIKIIEETIIDFYNVKE